MSAAERGLKLEKGPRSARLSLLRENWTRCCADQLSSQPSCADGEDQRLVPVSGDACVAYAGARGPSAGPPPPMSDIDYAHPAFIPPLTAESGLASFTLRGFSAGAWRSPAEGRWLIVDNDDMYTVEPGIVFVCTEGAQPPRTPPRRRRGRRRRWAMLSAVGAVVWQARGRQGAPRVDSAATAVVGGRFAFYLQHFRSIGGFSSWSPWTLSQRRRHWAGRRGQRQSALSR